MEEGKNSVTSLTVILLLNNLPFHVPITNIFILALCVLQHNDKNIFWFKFKFPTPLL